VTGVQAETFLQAVMTNDLRGLESGHCLYSLLCYNHGGVVDDLIIYKQDNDRFLLVVNASNSDKDFQHLAKQAGNFKVELKNISESTDLISLQGPDSRKILQGICDKDLTKLPYLQFSPANVSGIPVIISRTGYTGELGYEIFCFPGPNGRQTGKLWQTLADLGAVPCGLGARDILRLEMKYPLYGHELTQDINPLEAGLGWAVKLGKPDFTGRASLVKIQDQGLKRTLVGIEMNGRQIARAKATIFDSQGWPAGEVTSGTFSPSLDKSVAMGYVSRDLAAVGTDLQVEIREAKYPAKVSKTPFVTSHVRD